ncbi:MAG: hypothetical protein FWD47_04195 [Treponema sp.]|nr:hypothetical protein [Treponema sp.]
MGLNHKKAKILFLVLAVCIVFTLVFAETITALGFVKCHKAEFKNNSFSKNIKEAGSGFYLSAFLESFCNDTQKYSSSVITYVSSVLLKVRFNS